MSQDIDAALRDWEFKPGEVQARQVQAGDGRQVLQMRMDLGIVQMEMEGRPDGTRPNDFPTYFQYVASQAAKKKRFVLSEEQCQEADREFIESLMQPEFTPGKFAGDDRAPGMGDQRYAADGVAFGNEPHRRLQLPRAICGAAERRSSGVVGKACGLC